MSVLDEVRQTTCNGELAQHDPLVRLHDRAERRETRQASVRITQRDEERVEPAGRSVFREPGRLPLDVGSEPASYEDARQHLARGASP